MTKQQISKRAKMDRLADLLANDFGVYQAADRMGVARSYASKLLMLIRAELGWQAQ